MKVIILAGGSGSRLWPMSRKNTPKQVQPFIDNETLLQKTYNRLRKGFDAGDIFVSTGKNYVQDIYGQLPELPLENLIVEPCKKDTAAAIGLVATRFYFHNPKEIIITVHSDHFIDNDDEYLRILKLVGKVIASNPEYGGLVGIKPTYPETGYGYIKMNGQFSIIGNDEIFTVEKFIEKPNLRSAEELIKHWEYLWNPGYFIWRVDTLLAQYKKHLPRMYKIFVKINQSLGTKQEQEIINEEFDKIKPIAFDYGILEKVNNLLVVPTDFSFTDIGNWRTIKSVLQKQKNENIIKGTVIEVDSSNTLIYNFTESVISVAGLKNMIVVATDDATFICHEDSVHEAKNIVKKLTEQHLDKYT